MNRRSFLVGTVMLPLAAAASRFPGVESGALTVVTGDGRSFERYPVATTLPEREIITLGPGVCIGPYDTILIDGEVAWVAGMSGDTATIIRVGKQPLAPVV